jgi:predicted outer membrane lipoprotein
MMNGFRFPWNAVFLAALAAILVWAGVEATTKPLLLAAAFLLIRALVEFVSAARRKKLAAAGTA